MAANPLIKIKSQVGIPDSQGQGGEEKSRGKQGEKHPGTVEEKHHQNCSPRFGYVLGNTAEKLGRTGLGINPDIDSSHSKVGVTSLDKGFHAVGKPGMDE